MGSFGSARVRPARIRPFNTIANACAHVHPRPLLVLESSCCAAQSSKTNPKESHVHMNGELTAPHRDSIQSKGLPGCGTCSFPHPAMKRQLLASSQTITPFLIYTVLETRRGAPVRRPWLAARAPAGRRRSPNVSTRDNSAPQRPTSACVNVTCVATLCCGFRAANIFLAVLACHNMSVTAPPLAATLSTDSRLTKTLCSHVDM